MMKAGPADRTGASLLFQLYRRERITNMSEITIESILNIGFEHATFFDPSGMEFRQEVRDMCTADKCQMYNRCWACPPACGSIEDSIEKAKKYSHAVMMQTTALLEDSFDFETMIDAANNHKKRFSEAVMLIRSEYPDCLPMGAGGCNICKPCTYPDAPCRFPEKAFTSMEAYGLFVSAECKKAGLEYNYGPNTLTYSSCILF